MASGATGRDVALQRPIGRAVGASAGRTGAALLAGDGGPRLADHDLWEQQGLPAPVSGLAALLPRKAAGGIANDDLLHCGAPAVMVLASPPLGEAEVGVDHPVGNGRYPTRHVICERSDHAPFGLGRLLQQRNDRGDHADARLRAEPANGYLGVTHGLREANRVGVARTAPLSRRDHLSHRVAVKSDPRQQKLSCASHLVVGAHACTCTHACTETLSTGTSSSSAFACSASLTSGALSDGTSNSSLLVILTVKKLSISEPSKAGRGSRGHLAGRRDGTVCGVTEPWGCSRRPARRSAGYATAVASDSSCALSSISRAISVQSSSSSASSASFTPPRSPSERRVSASFAPARIPSDMRASAGWLSPSRTISTVAPLTAECPTIERTRSSRLSRSNVAPFGEVRSSPPSVSCECGDPMRFLL